MHIISSNSEFFTILWFVFVKITTKKIYFHILSDEMSNVVFKEFNSCIFKSIQMYQLKYESCRYEMMVKWCLMKKVFNKLIASEASIRFELTGQLISGAAVSVTTHERQ